ncbi:unnamed protein product [Arabidopsis lyrata]|uniref:Uncharacterized protein n=1 Tax=Arabidopsis lyrata subsp. lyrata TaxID=81972 RepID=D7LH65_ARALL|nr:hypothetical protein ARALYDRAFT_903453 [Arabidopsis lyrata subsp. lyrata]CAH8265557.1 unnamed protein product [Arabidopsis lyrata]
MDDDMASSKVIMNREELLLFVENKRKEDTRRDCALALTELVESFVAANKESFVQLIKKKKMSDSASRDGTTPSIQVLGFDWTYQIQE